MKHKSAQTTNNTSDRLTEIANILALGIYRLKQREQKERNNGLYEPVSTLKHQNPR